ncbi:HAD family hydrolase [Selenomonas sp. TAMA-11512]|uniref:HAD family hydrolase n=1 Tax=Selenomonas sp. TAMA-11512 TaxID=3095337 RepID=UPI00308EDFD6|nr:HAD family hydrolase [Selenomonas sp. TAMA-11512]
MSRENITAVIFDMDGLMFDTEMTCYESYLKATAEEQRDLPLAVYKRTIGLNRAGVKAVYMEYFDGDEAFVDRIMAKEAEYSLQYVRDYGVPKKAGLDSLLAYLEESGIKAAVASSSNRETVVDLIERAGIRSSFSAVCCGDEVRESKPHPEIFLRAAEMLDAATKNALVLEDSKNGLKAAKTAGIRSILIPDMLDPNDEMLSLCTKVCKSLSEVPAYIDGVNA